MDFRTDREHSLLMSMYTAFADAEVKPFAREVDEKELFPVETVRKMARCGMLGIPFPKEFGGAGGDNLGYVMAVEAVSKACGTTGVILSAHTSLCAAPIYEFGTPDQKRKYLFPLARGEKLGAFGLTEPNAGTDAAGQQSTAELKGDHYLLNGSKIFITNAGQADVLYVFAMTDRSKGVHGVSAFIVEKGMPGFSIGKKEEKMGIRGSSTACLYSRTSRFPRRIFSARGKRDSP